MCKENDNWKIFFLGTLFRKWNYVNKIKIIATQMKLLEMNYQKNEWIITVHTMTKITEIEDKASSKPTLEDKVKARSEEWVAE